MADPAVLRQIAKPGVLRAQKKLGMRPSKICLITGAPRSGTSAVCRWLLEQPRVAGSSESRLLVAMHGFMHEVERFEKLKQRESELARLGRHLVYDYYSQRHVLIDKRVVVEKEPLEPIAFPDGGYEGFIEDTKRLLPGLKVLFLVRDPVATIWSMTQRAWGYSVTDTEPHRFSLEEHIDNWCACAQLALRYADDPDTYLCHFGSLIAAPETESKAIFRFLGIPRGRPFEPRGTKEVGFSPEEKELVLQRTESLTQALRARASN